MRAIGVDEGNIKIEKFDNVDSGFWKIQIEHYLYQKKLYQLFLRRQLEGGKDEDWALLDRQALRVIWLTLSHNVAFNIAKESRTTCFITALSSMYKKQSTSNKVHLIRRLFTLLMVKRIPVDQHLNELNIITTQLNSMEIEFNYEIWVLILLSHLLDGWNAIVGK